MSVQRMMSLEGRCGPSLDLDWETHPFNHGEVPALAVVLLAGCDIRAFWLDLTGGKGSGGKAQMTMVTSRIGTA